MARVILTAVADSDVAAIIEDLAREAGLAAALKYRVRFERLFDRLVRHPESSAPRPRFGLHVRMGVVRPYLVFYRHLEAEEIVSILRVVHGRRRVTRDLLTVG